VIPSGRIRAVLGPLLEDEAPPAGWDASLARFLAELATWSRRFNLVSRSTIDLALESHVLPSLATLRIVARDESVRVLDVGSGAGFPGIPLAILRPRAQVDLVEATRKKCRFLEHCISTLELPEARVHWCRIEQPAPALRDRAPFDVAVSRAVGLDERAIGATRELLAPTGRFWTFTDPKAPGALVWEDAEGRPVTALAPSSR